jgi:hypothetical protein
MVDANTAGLDVTAARDGKVQFSKKASGFTLCFFDGTYYVPVSVDDNSVVKSPGGETTGPSDNTTGKGSCPGYPGQNIHYTLHLRSVEQVFYYLGTLISPDAGDYVIRKNGPHKGCPVIAFFIYKTPVPHIRFTVEYRDGTYYVADTARTDECGGGVVDNTMPILAILNDLLNLNRDASETPTTKAVQAVGGG